MTVILDFYYNWPLMFLSEVRRIPAGQVTSLQQLYKVYIYFKGTVSPELCVI
jgi:hypothetical protein